jgi:ATP-dependent Clp protease ATP-binding subunit ClpB
MTSNLGSEYLMQESVDEDKLLEVVHQFFRPEFLNRLDEILIFRRLSSEQVRRIVDIQVDRVAQRLAARGIALNVTDTARELISREGYDPSFGARPLKRVIRRELEDKVARLLLSGGVGEGSVVTVDAAGDELTLAVAPPVAA